MKNIATSKTQKTNLSFGETVNENKKIRKEAAKMKRHFIAIMKRIAAERPAVNMISIY